MDTLVVGLQIIITLALAAADPIMLVVIRIIRQERTVVMDTLLLKCRYKALYMHTDSRLPWVGKLKFQSV